MVGLDDVDPGHRRQREGRRASRSRRATPSTGRWSTTAATRKYDLLLGNDRQYSNTPWTYYQYIFQLPILDNQTTVNYERFTEPEGLEPDAAAGQDADRRTRRPTRPSCRSCRRSFLQNLPAIPLWYNGMWSMFNTTVLDELAVQRQAGQYTPTSWRNYWQMTSIDMLTHLKPQRHVAGARSGDRATPLPATTGRGVVFLRDDADRGMPREALPRPQGLHLPRHVLSSR